MEVLGIVGTRARASLAATVEKARGFLGNGMLSVVVSELCRKLN